LPTLLECIQSFKTRVGEPDLFLPTADQALDDLERQSFDMSNKANPGYRNFTPAPKSFASKLLGLLARETKLERKYRANKIKYSYLRAVSIHVHTGLQSRLLN